MVKVLVIHIACVVFLSLISVGLILFIFNFLLRIDTFIINLLRRRKERKTDKDYYERTEGFYQRALRKQLEEDDDNL